MDARSFGRTRERVVSSDDLRWLRLHCTYCEAVSERGIAPSQLSVTRRGEFVAIACPQCGQLAASPTVRPWDLSFNDRKLLRTMRITVE